MSKQYLLQLARQIADFLGLTVAFTAALVQVYPEILNRADPGKIAIMLVIIVGFGALKGGVAHIQDKPLRDALNAVLDAVQQNIPMSERDTRQTRTVQPPGGEGGSQFQPPYR